METIYHIYGSIEGYLVHINPVSSQKIGICNVLDNTIVECIFPINLFEQAKQLLRRRVYVFGLIRQYLHGSKIDIEVQEMKLLIY